MQGVGAFEWINTSRYPLDRPGSVDFNSTVDAVRRQLSVDGCAVLREFIKAEHLADLAAQVAILAPRAHFTQAEVTVYGGEPDESFPDSHPRRRTLKRRNGFVAGDLIGGDCALRPIYHSAELQAFLAACVGADRIYEFADPLAQLVVNVIKPNETHSWHFDSNEFAVSLMTRRAEAGGEFEYVPNIRSSGFENYPQVEAVLSGDSSGIQVLDLRPGDLQIFLGRYSLHRVRQTRGPRDRHTVILAYAKHMGMVGQPEKTAALFGRKLSVHASSQGQRREDQLTG
jgi:hypothetical protein